MTQTDVACKRRWTSLIAITTFTTLLFVFCGGLLHYLITPPTPEQVFERATGFRWPSNAIVISSGGDGLVTDGEFHVVFSVDEATISQWRRVQPVTPLSQWQSGPVPTEIGAHCAFGKKYAAYLTRHESNEEVHYAGDPELVDLLSSDKIMYSAHDERYGSIPWHNGRLLILDNRTNKVWLSIWNF